MSFVAASQPSGLAVSWLCGESAYETPQAAKLAVNMASNFHACVDNVVLDELCDDGDASMIVQAITGDTTVLARLCTAKENDSNPI